MKFKISESRLAKEFPKLMTGNDGKLIILVNKDLTGMVVASNTDDYKIGDINNHWVLERFTDFTGSITLSND